MPNLKPTHIEPTAEEDVTIEAAVAGDPDAISWDEDAPLTPASEAHPDMVTAWRKTRGKQKLPAKEIITIRLDPDVVDHFRATGRGWQSRINHILREAAFGPRET